MSRERLLVPLALAGMAVVVYAVVGDAACHRQAPVRSTAPVADASVAVTPPPLPRMEPTREPDAGAIDDDTLTFEVLRTVGPLGREARWLPELLAQSVDWKAAESGDDDDGPTWQNDHGHRLTWVVENGRVVAARAEFTESAMSASAMAMSPVLLGVRSGLPINFEVGEVTHEPLTGSFEVEGGRTFYYRAEMRTTGDPPYGPRTLEVRPRPF